MLSRMYEEHELPQDQRALYAEIRAAFDLPFVPSVFKLLAGSPPYLKAMWHDLAPVAQSREFQTASRALEEYARSLAVRQGWRFSDQGRLLAAQKFSSGDIEQLAGVVGVFVRALPRMALFTRLLQLGYSGGQRGRISPGKQASALARLVTVHVPNERDAGMRVWLLYNDIRKTTGSQHVLSVFRVISPYPGYLASVWLDAKRLFADEDFWQARNLVAKRARALLNGLPVRDHRKLLKGFTPAQWMEVERAVDGFAKQTPQFALVSAVWQRSFATSANTLVAA